MYTPNDIQNTVRRVHSAKCDVQSTESMFKNELENVALWWQGNASKSFTLGYLEARYEINRLYSGITNLEDGLRRLASEVQRADDERRRIEAERRRKEQMENNKC